MNPARDRRAPVLLVAAAVALFVALSAGLCWALGGNESMFDKSWWAQQPERWMLWRTQAPVTFVFGFMLLFVLLSALALPGCGPLALMAGSAFGTMGGALLVGLASTLGATLSFLAARHGARQAVQRRLGHRLVAVDAAISRHGRFGLFWLRLLPVVPFPVLNPLLGVSRLSLSAFFWPSLAGLTLGSVPYVWLGGSLLAMWQAGSLNHGVLAGAAALLAATAWFARQRLRRAAVMAGPAR